MELKSERKIIRWVMILAIVTGMSGIGILFSSYPSDSSKNAVLDTEIAMSGFGDIKLFNPEKAGLFSTNTYQDKQLGFQISKPNSNWEIHSTLDELSSDELSSLKAKGFLDGLYIEQNHDKKFMLTVFDIQKENFSLHEFVDQQISLMESQKYAIIPFEQISPENDWALFTVEISDDNELYEEQLLFLKENRLYMLQYFGEPPQALSSDQKNDFQFIMDSFEVI